MTVYVQRDFSSKKTGWYFVWFDFAVRRIHERDVEKTTGIIPGREFQRRQELNELETKKNFLFECDKITVDVRFVIIYPPDISPYPFDNK